MKVCSLLTVVGSAMLVLMPVAGTEPPGEAYPAPCAVVAAADGQTLYVALAGMKQVAVYDVGAVRIGQRISVPAEPTGLALAADGSRLYVTCAAPAGSVAVIDTKGGTVVRTIAAGHGACAPVLAEGGKRLYVCNRFLDEVSAVDLETGKAVARIAVSREPHAAAMTPDGKVLVVANLLPAMPSTSDLVAAAVSLIDTGSNSVLAELLLPNGSNALRGVCVSPDGKYTAITHILAHFTLPTTQVERGWMNANTLTLVDIGQKKLVNTILLDNLDSGAANPWAAAWTADGNRLCVTHTGTHELSIIDIRGVFEKFSRVPAEDVPSDLAFLVDLRRRVRLSGNGPRSMAVTGDKAYVAEYFSDSLSVVDLATGSVAAVSLADKSPMSAQRKGEMLFNDASLCFQTWQSCASCHPDARVDGLNWDLLNDEMGNPKNTRSMLLAHQTPPVMSLGIRDTAETAVRSGIRVIQFAVRPEEDAVAIDEYLKSLRPVPSPHLVDGKLSESAQRGQKIFMDSSVGCANCHPSGLLTNLKSYDVGTAGPLDGGQARFDTPTLVETWRTVPYLHDGSAATLRDVVTKANKNDRHGKTSDLSKEQIDDLVAYLLSQ